MVFLHIFLTMRHHPTTWPRSARFFLLACVCLCTIMHATQTASCAVAQASFTSSANRRFLQLDRREFRENRRLKLERLPGSRKDRYQTLRAAIHRDQARRQTLEWQLLDRFKGKIVPTVPPTTLTNASVSTGGGGGLSRASLDVISGSSVGSGEYFATVSVGTPPQKLFLIADTGSDLTWVKCGGGKGKGKMGTNRSFDEAASSSFVPLSCISSQCAAWSYFPPACNSSSDGTFQHCKLSYSYSDQSFISGLFGVELITLGESSLQAKVVMGCVAEYAGPNFDKAGGVLGLGQGTLSLATQLTAQSGYAMKFSYCLADFLGSSTVLGSLAFGDTLSQEPIKYTPLIQNPYAKTYYYVGIKEVRVNGVTLILPAHVWEIDAQGNGGTIIDSGTTLARFVKPAYEAIRDAFRQAIPETPLTKENSVAGLELCYKTDVISMSSGQSFPKFTIVLDGDLALEPPQENYFTQAAPGITCLAMQEATPGTFSVIGNLLQQNFHMEFDRFHSRLGVVPTECSKLLA